MDTLTEYRAKHALEYQKRVQEEKIKEIQNAIELAEKHAEEERIKAFNDAFVADIESCSVKLLVCNSSINMLEILAELNNNIELNIHKWSDNNNIVDNNQMMKKIVDAVLKVFESVNNNSITKINFNNRHDINTSKNIQQTMKSILSKVGIQHEDDNLEVNYEMDCSQDEELAQRLYLEEQQRVNELMPHQLLPIPPPPLNRRQRRAASVDIPQVHVDPRIDGVPPTPRRGRGRPRRTTATANITHD